MREDWCGATSASMKAQISSMGCRSPTFGGGVEQLVVQISYQLLWHCGVDLSVRSEVRLDGCLEQRQSWTTPPPFPRASGAELTRREAASTLNIDAFDAALPEEVCQLTLLLGRRIKPGLG